MEMAGRGFSGSYRFGYQGSEKDDEVNQSDGTSYTTEFRQLDPRLGRWFSVDPLAFSYPYITPYASMHNNPINITDVMGLGPDDVTIDGKKHNRKKLDKDPTGKGKAGYTDDIDLGGGKTGKGKYIDPKDKSKGFYSFDDKGNYYELTPAEQKNAQTKAKCYTPNSPMAKYKQQQEKKENENNKNSTTGAAKNDKQKKVASTTTSITGSANTNSGSSNYADFKKNQSQDHGVLYDIWNSEIVRAQTPDFYTIGLNYWGTWMGGSEELTWVLHGPEASIFPIRITNISIGLSDDIMSGGVTGTMGKYLGSAEDIKRSMVTNTYMQNFSGTVGLKALGKVSVGGGYVMTGTGYGIVNLSGGFGGSLSLGIPVIIQASTANTVEFHDYK